MSQDLSDSHELFASIRQPRGATVAVRLALRRRLGFYVSATGANPRNHEAEDLYQEAMSKIVQMLHDLQIVTPKTDIANFDQYVARVASNVCIDYLRTKSPARTRHLRTARATRLFSSVINCNNDQCWRSVPPLM
jgi:DNA-directed RNA polymerase specialized sigma24 family protein